MAGLDVAAATVQFVSLAVSTIQGCLEAYNFCETAQKIGKDGDLLRTKLRFESLRLEQWGFNIGLLGLPEHDRSPNNRFNWSMILDILKQQELLLTSAETLKKRYSLELPEDSEEMAETVARDGNGVDRILSRLSFRPHHASPSAQKIYQRNGVVKRLRWAAGDRDKIHRVITELGSLNDHLYSLTNVEQQERLGAKVESIESLLRTLISQTTTPEDAAICQSILPRSAGNLQSAAAFKRIRLNLAFDKRDDEAGPDKHNRGIRNEMPQLQILVEKWLIVASNTTYSGLEPAMYKQDHVLIEWRVAEGPMFAKVQNPMRRLTLLLMSADASFAAMKCLGLLELRSRGRFGMVFTPPALPSSTDVLCRSPRSLNTLLEQARWVPLDMRVKVAIRAAATIAQLHTAGWLHKSVRSENIIFVSSEADDAETFLTRGSYLVGYGLARPDTAQAAVSLTETPDTALDAELYRHPEKRNDASKPFCKTYDLYGLGCVLLELALWRPLIDIVGLHEKQNWRKLLAEAEATRQDIELASMLDVLQKPSLRSEVHHNVGSIFWDAICLCFGSTATIEEDEISMARQTSIVEMLRACSFRPL
ncbi:hypothetical protein EJ03DRAFT_77586 [Teratosphaeria nubilosa]|uniref:Protein kinase domain-containing protein n=1 Tax=Teratosphaeria nubilosa TaxID=161662 RepID=A0A6G1LCU9_9PEZI|nr:hypothetical protein EJ03DRAFT_77586 [Teratosphaeria nubilosa]